MKGNLDFASPVWPRGIHFSKSILDSDLHHSLGACTLAKSNYPHITSAVDSWIKPQISVNMGQW